MPLALYCATLSLELGDRSSAFAKPTGDTIRMFATLSSLSLNHETTSYIACCMLLIDASSSFNLVVSSSFTSFNVLTSTVNFCILTFVSPILTVVATFAPASARYCRAACSALFTVMYNKMNNVYVENEPHLRYLGTLPFFARLGLLPQCLVCLLQRSNFGEGLVQFGCCPVGFVAQLLQTRLFFLVSPQRCLYFVILIA